MDQQDQTQMILVLLSEKIISYFHFFFSREVLFVQMEKELRMSFSKSKGNQSQALFLIIRGKKRNHSFLGIVFQNLNLPKEEFHHYHQTTKCCPPWSSRRSLRQEQEGGCSVNEKKDNKWKINNTLKWLK